MIKTVPILLLMMLIVSLTRAQQRHCGTTEYYQLRYDKDPALKTKMEEDEARIQQWIKDHPQSSSAQHKSSKNQSSTAFPELSGFKATGDEVKDREAYKIA